MATAVKEPRAFTDVLRQAHAEFEAIINGRSMGRTLPANSRVRVRPISASSEDVAIGAIILHRAVNERLVAHRVIAGGRNLRGVPFVITQGDSQWVCDMPVDVAEVIGTVVSRWNENDWTELPAELPQRSAVQRFTSLISLRVVLTWARLTRRSQRARVSRWLLWLRR